jgi:hypothetical protein
MQRRAIAMMPMPGREVIDGVWDLAEESFAEIETIPSKNILSHLLKRESTYLRFFTADFSLHMAKIETEARQNLRDTYKARFLKKYTPGIGLEERAPRYAEAFQKEWTEGITAPVGFLFVSLCGKDDLRTALLVEASFQTYFYAIPKFLQDLGIWNRFEEDEDSEDEDGENEE